MGYSMIPLWQEVTEEKQSTCQQLASTSAVMTRAMVTLSQLWIETRPRYEMKPVKAKAESKPARLPSNVLPDSPGQ